MTVPIVAAAAGVAAHRPARHQTAPRTRAGSETDDAPQHDQAAMDLGRGTRPTRTNGREITGANTGLGFQTAKVLAQHGATGVLACRNPDKAAAAAATIGAAAPTATVSTLQLDLASQASVRRAGDQLRTDHLPIDTLR